MLKLSRIPQGKKANRSLKRNEATGLKGNAPPDEAAEVEKTFKLFWQNRSRRAQEAQEDTPKEEAT